MIKADKIFWYCNRLSLMGFDEILLRFVNKFAAIKEKRVLKNQKTLNFPFKINDFLFDLTNTQNIINFYDENPEYRNYLINKADAILEHKFSFFGLKDEDFGEKINWHKDYMSSKVCENVFYTEVDYKNHEKNGDIKYIWEINRFQHFYLLAQAYYITKNEKYALEIISEIDDWITQNPYLTGVNWTSSLELAIRLIAWGWAVHSLNLFGYGFSEIFKSRLSRSIHQQADYIFKHLSAFSSANNHLIGEAAGLVITGCLFDFGEKSGKWRERGFVILLNELEKQVFPDGVSKEQTLAYHGFVFDFYILSFLILEKNGVKIPECAWKKLERMAEVIFKFSDDNLNLPNIGDADDGYVVSLMHNPAEKNTKYVLNTAAILFKRGDFKQKAGNSLDEKTIWLLGQDAFEKYFNLPDAALSKESFFLEYGGYVLFKDDNTDAVMDVGPLGYMSIAAHGHADALSLCLNYKGEEFLIDLGTYAYHTKPEWRNYFRGTSAHNTVEVDGLNQSKICGNFMWSQKADVKTENVALGSDYSYVKASHNGYLKQKNGVNHIREVIFVKGEFFLVKDTLLNRRKLSHDYSLSWHFAEDCALDRLSDSRIRAVKGENILDLRQFVSEGSSLKIIRGSINPIEGWISKKYDVKYPVSTLKTRVKSLNNVNFVSIISFNEALENVINKGENLTITTAKNQYAFSLREDLLLSFIKSKK